MNYPVHNLEDILFGVRLLMKQAPEPLQGKLLSELQKTQGLMKELRRWEAEKRVERRNGKVHGETPSNDVTVANRQVM